MKLDMGITILNRRTIMVCEATIFVLIVLFISPTLEQEQKLNLSSNEREALFGLRSSLGLRSREWPRKQDPCLNWTGIQCENGSVIGINISGFRRTRLGLQNPQFDVDSLANLTMLRSFNASGFLLPGSIPDWFGQRLVSIRVLDLRSCSVSNAIPQSLGNLRSLTSLYLSDNKLRGLIPSSLRGLRSLVVLDLSRNSLTGSIPAWFASFENLTRLDVSSNILSGSIASEIGILAKLQYLNASNNGLSSSVPPLLGSLSSLVDLDLSANRLSGSIPVELSQLTNIKRMIIGRNLLTGSLPANLFTNLSELQIVDLGQNNFVGSVPDALWLLPALLFLDISGNNFTGELNATVNSNATKAVLNISYNLFYGALGPVLRRFRSVDLSGNYFEGRVPDYVSANASVIRNCLQNESDQRSLSNCSSFYDERGLMFDNFGNPNSTGPPQRGTSGKSNRRVIILASVLGGVGVIVLLLLLLLLLLCIRKRSRTNQKDVGVRPVPSGGTPVPPVVSTNFSSVGDSFTYKQLLQATSDFNDANLMKHGHSGDLYMGYLENGARVVIKKVNLQSKNNESYLSELEFFSKVLHPRLVPLLGHCLENDHEKFLVYKYMPNGDLSNSLFRKTNTEEDGLQSLDWITRLKIATGAAEGLSYLHHDCTPPIVHRDVQTSSILLDDKFEVRLGSLSEVSAREGDVSQSKITRLLRLPSSSEQGPSASAAAICSYDVYCFGKVLLELITGKLGVSAFSDAQLKDWLLETLPYISIYEKELVTKIIDPSLIIDEDLLEEVWAMAIVARSCLNPKPSRRPLMRYVLKALENPLKVVREEHTGSAQLRTTSSRGSWYTAMFGSWRSSSDAAAISGGFSMKRDGGSKHSATSNSQGSGQNGSGDRSSSHRRYSSEIFPEPSNEQDIERQVHD